MFITYRARLEGTFQTDSGYLISLIEDWVRTGPSFIVNGMLMKVNSQCSVVITSLSDRECTQTIAHNSPSSAEASYDTPVIIGGVVAIAIALIVGVVVVLVYIVRFKTRQTFETTVAKNPEDQ